MGDRISTIGMQIADSGDLTEDIALRMGHVGSDCRRRRRPGGGKGGGGW